MYNGVNLCEPHTSGTGIDVCVCMLACSHLSYGKSCGTKTQNMCSSNKMLIAVGVVTMNGNTMSEGLLIVRDSI